MGYWPNTTGTAVPSTNVPTTTTSTVNYPYYWYYPQPCQGDKTAEVLERIIIRLEKRIEELQKELAKK